jgi:hypothetical protein
MGHIAERSLDVCIVVVGLGSTGDTSGTAGTVAWPGLRYDELLLGIISGVVGVVGVVP